jgi:hypothetical protein
VAKNKIVANKRAGGSVEESFGGASESVAVRGGTMHKFGHTYRDGVWPTNPISVDQKSGYPQGAQDKTKASK